MGAIKVKDLFAALWICRWLRHGAYLITLNDPDLTAA
jgi:hypothetical protein